MFILMDKYGHLDIQVESHSTMNFGILWPWPLACTWLCYLALLSIEKIDGLVTSCCSHQTDF